MSVTGCQGWEQRGMGTGGSAKGKDFGVPIGGVSCHFCRPLDCNRVHPTAVGAQHGCG